MPSISNADKFYSTRSTSSSSMLPFITQSSIGSSVSHKLNEISSDWKMLKSNRYGEFDIGSLKRNIEKEMEESNSHDIYARK